MEETRVLNLVSDQKDDNDVIVYRHDDKNTDSSNDFHKCDDDRNLTKPL